MSIKRLVLVISIICLLLIAGCNMPLARGGSESGGGDSGGGGGGRDGGGGGGGGVLGAKVSAARLAAFAR